MTSSSHTHDTHSRPAHESVLSNAVLDAMRPKEGEIYVDGTFGAGGHTRLLLDAANCHVYGIDRDPHVDIYARALKEEVGDRFTFLSGKFSDMASLLEKEGIKQVDGILLDVGVSSMQLDTAERGFSFSHDGPLDMRMAQEGRDAASLVNSADEKELADILFQYGGERKSRRIAKAVVEAREEKSITRTGELAAIIRKVVKGAKDKIDPATRSFQALRIWVNGELEELEEALQAAEKLLKPGGRLVVISFHSGEDSIVKQFLKERSGKAESYSRYQPLPDVPAAEPTFRLLAAKAVKATDEEIAGNPRSRSARLRAAIRTEAGR